MSDTPHTTSDAGIPATSDEHSLTVGPDGPILLQDSYLVQKMQQFNRERVPERVVHAKGGGAHGYFETTDDVSAFTKASLFQPGSALMRYLSGLLLLVKPSQTVLCSGSLPPISLLCVLTLAEQDSPILRRSLR